MRHRIAVSAVVALGGTLLVAGPAAADPGDPTFKIKKATSLSAPAVELTSVASCTGGDWAEFTTTLSQIQYGVQAIGTGTTRLLCDGAQHTVYTLVLADQPGTYLSSGATATKTEFHAALPSQYPWTALQTIKAKDGEVTPRADTPGAPAVALDHALLDPYAYAIDATYDVTCAAGTEGWARLNLAKEARGHLVRGTATQHITCTGAAQQFTTAIPLAGGGPDNAQTTVIEIDVDARTATDPGARTDRWAESSLGND